VVGLHRSFFSFALTFSAALRLQREQVQQQALVPGGYSSDS
jgi:hypothetical protein